MSEKEKQHTSQILDVLNKLSEAKGPEFTEGLIAGINIGASRVGEANEQPG